MSDPIAAAEAAGKARDIANRFETAVFLIAYGIAEKDGLYEADPHRYPYSQAFRHGMNILAALCAECSDDAEKLLPTFNESDFIRNSAASDVREWTARWRDECRKAVEGCRSIEIGPLASVDGDYFAATSECYEVLRGCMVQLYKNDMRVNLPAPLHLAEQVEEYIWDWELTGRR